eukprot:TRINITY_DN61327_c0_g1_i1.p1 TRINITY_DN61327_c0_g1~~TRINITY_DN61327_c0_g1_i1.p1  ORF type:complete len:1140 (+),score=234.28 TRINITY_DN61327_c0_g1_i1:107-3526(+)
MEFARQCIFGRKEEASVKDQDAEDTLAAIQAPINEDSTIHILMIRGLAEALEGEWPEPDEAWLDRIIIGKLTRNPNDRNKSAGDFLGFLLASNAFPFSDFTGGKVRKSCVDGPFLFTGWNASNPELKVDWLHLLPLSGEDISPIESMDLSKLTCEPGTSLVGSEEEENYALTLEFGGVCDEFIIKGGTQAARWTCGVKAALLSSGSEAIEIEPHILVMQMQKYDKLSEEKARTEHHNLQHDLIEDFAKSQCEDEEIAWSPFSEVELVDYDSDLPDKVSEMLKSRFLKVDTIELLDAIKSVAMIPSLLVLGAVRREPPRHDILDFWERTYHERVCRSFDVLWNDRAKKLTSVELAAFAMTVDSYRKWMSTVYIEDASLGKSVDEIGLVWGRRTFPPLIALAEKVADMSEIIRSRDGWGGYCTSASCDLLTFLGPACEVALKGPLEMRDDAAKVVDATLLAYKKRLKSRIQKAEESGSIWMMAIFIAALLTDSADFAQKIKVMLAEGVGDLSQCSGTFCKIEGRFREATEVYLERLVTIAFEQTGAALEFGNPPSINNVVDTDIQRLVSEVLMPAIKTFQTLLDEPARSSFALRFVTRFVAYELYTLIFCTPSGSWGQSAAPPPQKIADAIQGHRAKLAAAVAVWCDETDPPHAETRSPNALADVAALLVAPPTKLGIIVHAIKQMHGGSFTQDICRKILTYRTDAEKEVIDNACAKASPNKPQASGRASRTSARKSYFAIQQGNLGSRKGTSVFGWISDHKWAEDMAADLCANSSGAMPAWNEAIVPVGEDAFEVAMQELAPEVGTGKYERRPKEKEVLTSIDDFFASLGESGQSASEDGDSSDDEDGNKKRLKDGGEGGASPKGGGKKRDSWESDSALWSDTFCPSDDGDDEYFLRGVLAKQDAYKEPGAESKKPAEPSFFDVMFGAAFSEVSKAGFEPPPGKWHNRCFQIEQDMRQNFILAWYKEVDNVMPLGKVLFSDMGKVSTSESNHQSGNYVISIEVLNPKREVDMTLELRSMYEKERSLWMEKIAGVQRFVEENSRMVVKRTELVKVLPDYLQIMDPEKSEQPALTEARGSFANKTRTLGKLAGRMRRSSEAMNGAAASSIAALKMGGHGSGATPSGLALPTVAEVSPAAEAD